MAAVLKLLDATKSFLQLVRPIDECTPEVIKAFHQYFELMRRFYDAWHDDGFHSITGLLLSKTFTKSSLRSGSPRTRANQE